MAIQDFTAGQILTAAQMDALQANDYNQTVSTKTDSYVLVAADKGTRLVMNSATAKTFTVNSGLFAAGDTLFIQNIGAGTATITAGTCTVTTAGSLALAQWGGGTLYFTSASAAIFFSGGGFNYGTFTGGDVSTPITVGGISYTLLTFNNTGTLTCTKPGLIDVLLVAGGGGGGSWSSTANQGGGGGGGVITSTLYLTANQTITIGAGGAAQARGSETYLGSATVGSQIAPVAVGGGAGSAAGQNTGGSSGGPQNNQASVAGITGQGSASGGGPGLGDGNGAGGGGGATAVGGNGTASVGGVGGAGLGLTTFTGTTLTSSVAGGGGGNRYSGASGAGGVGGGGAAGGTAAGTAGTANTGGGGGAGNGGAAGGKGVVYVRFKA